MMNEYADVLIIGAGVSGIGAACHLSMKCPRHRYMILESRDVMGGTWDLFRYPGVRSDSDMYTFGYSFRPWTEGKDIADGQDILRYVRETAAIYEVDRKIRYQHKVTHCHWDSSTSRWTVCGETTQGEAFAITCNYIISCTGYYDYEQGYLPRFEGFDDYQGIVAHPQHWPQHLVYKDQSVLVIGSGATAMTLVPNLALEAAHVTMVQRSPSYVFSRPAVDAIALWLNRCLPERLAYVLNRARNVLISLLFFTLSKKFPHLIRRLLRRQHRQALRPDIDVDTHFSPRYKPWDQRVCLIPDGDLYQALNSGKAEIVTDEIECFTPDGLRLKSGRELKADIIVPATGLKVLMMGGIKVDLDGRELQPGELLNYRGMMFDGVPNLTVIFGYTNASWTLKADLSATYVCRLLNHMLRHGHHVAMPSSEYGRRHWEFTDMQRAPIVGLSSGYIQRARGTIPTQGSKSPWRNHDNYILDRIAIKYGRLDDGVMVFR
jgi:cation diffusion facilitator CzcD-associated flavoprotein CzcO